MTHASVPEKERTVLGISDTLIRLSVGLEDEADIIEDLDQALNAAVSANSELPVSRPNHTKSLGQLAQFIKKKI